ncbi:fimbrial protein [Enterobacter dykesii]|uniref:fimbrial protein n=1 Tax=Enterobacter dykesii TaxID=2797506 RepID=UPI0032B4A81E
MKRIFHFLFFLMLYTLSTHSWAAGCINKTMNVTFTVPEITVPYGTSTGAKIWDSSYLTDSAGVNTTCGPSVFNSIADYGNDTGLTTADGCHIYSTNVKGIGYVITFGPISARYCNDFAPPNSVSGTWNFFGNNREMALYLTEKPESGTLYNGQYTHLKVEKTGDIIFNYLVSGGVIHATQCLLDNSNVQATLGDISSNVFKGVGSASDSYDFKIGLTCDGHSNISVTLNAEKSGETSDPTVIALTNTGANDTAKGIGVQILYNSQPIKLEESIPLISTEGGSQELLTFSARYYQTQEKIIPGEANSTATLDITYQ